MINSLKIFFTRLRDVMTGDGFEDPEVLGFIDKESDSKSYLEISKNPKYKIKTGLMIDLVPLPDEIENSFQHEE